MHTQKIPSKTLLVYPKKSFQLSKCRAFTAGHMSRKSCFWYEKKKISFFSKARKYDKSNLKRAKIARK